MVLKPYKQWEKLPVPQLVSFPDFCTINSRMSRWKLGSMVRITGLFHLLINGVFLWVKKTHGHPITFDPFTSWTSWNILPVCSFLFPKYYTGCLIGNLRMVYYNPHITGQHNPLYTLNNLGFLHCSPEQTNTITRLYHPTRSLCIPNTPFQSHGPRPTTPFLGGGLGFPTTGFHHRWDDCSIVTPCFFLKHGIHSRKLTWIPKMAIS